MAALLKKRALAEYCQTVVEDGPRPAKRLQLVRRLRPSDHSELNLATLEKEVPLEELLPTLMNLISALPVPGGSEDLLKKLVDLLESLMSVYPKSKEEEDQNPLQPVVVSKILMIMVSLAIKPSDVQLVMDKVCHVADVHSSKKTVAHAIQAAHAAASKPGTVPKVVDQAIHLALQHLSSSNALIKVHCLETFGGLCPVSPGKIQRQVISTLVEHSRDQDNRVRRATFTALVKLDERGIALPFSIYDHICQALNDDYQNVREVALSLLKVFSDKDPERMIEVSGTGEHIRLVDHAFSQLCGSVNDVSIRVRTQAVHLLGTLKKVSETFLLQTLDKNLMSNMMRKSSAHERARAMVESGEWSTGRRWADDSRREIVDVDAVQVINNGACGAFVHGLEDEFLEVRNATLDSICSLAIDNPPFANQCLDFLVDMFHDEIEDVRLKAIQVLQKIAHLIQLRPDQLDEILHTLKDSCLDIRESLHALLAICPLSTMSCITAAVNALLDNLHRYAQDKKSIHRCLKQLGSNHPELVLALVPQFLLIHPYFDGVEPSVQDGEYICKLILVFNAAAYCPTILPLLEEHTLRHYTYLRNTMPQFVPQLKLEDDVGHLRQEAKTNTVHFLRESMEKLRCAEKGSTQLKQTVYSTVYSDFVKLADIDPALSPAAKFAALYTQCLLLFTKVFSTRNWVTPSSLSVQQSSALRTCVDQLMKNTLRLRYAFSNLTPRDEYAVRSLRVRTQAFQLVYVVHGSTGSALGLCDNFLEHTEALSQYLVQKELSCDSFIDAVLQELSQLEEPRPGAVARILQPLLLAHPVPPLSDFEDPHNIQMCYAEILEPAADNETVFKLSAGLVVAVPLDAELWHLPDTSSLRIRVSYPDHSHHLIVPSMCDLRSVDTGCHRLLTTVLITAQVWSEACQVGISLVLDLSEQEALGGRRHTTAKTDDSGTLIQLCDPVKVLVWPKAVRKGI